MLIEFTLKNYTSFFEETTFSMQANNSEVLKKFNTFSSNGFGRLLKSAFVFGANGSGKSNFVKSALYMRSIIVSDLILQGRLLEDNNFFLFNTESINMPRGFEMIFVAKDDKMYKYGFEFQKGEIVSENLEYKSKGKKPVVLFSRKSSNFEDITLSEQMKDVEIFKKNTRPDTLFLYWGNAGNNKFARNVFEWFGNLQIFDATNSNSLVNITYDYIKKNEHAKSKVLEFIQKADFDIVDFDFKEIEDEQNIKLLKKIARKNIFENTAVTKKLEFTTQRALYNESKEKIAVVECQSHMESLGTLKLFSLAGAVLSTLENGNVIFLDEIDSNLHPNLVRYVVELFNSISQNANNAQLICNTHNALLLEEAIRIDQIYFVEKDERGASSMYSLDEFKGATKNNQLMEQYLIGLYGATPKTRRFLPLKEPVLQPSLLD
ncbi:MAG: ATP-binding protein [Oscillospiraceae bacterium]|nr:ATP-binding protein [Oscillospiraceae bacterium]